MSKEKDFREEALNKKWSQQDQYKFVKKSNDPRFGEISIYKNDTSKEVVFMKTNVHSQAKDAHGEIDNLMIRKALNHPGVLKFIDYSSEVKKGLCSTSYIVNSIYFYPKTDVHKEALSLKEKKEKFSGYELEKIAVQSLQGLAHLHNRELTYGDIRPQMIGYNHIQQKYFIMNRLKDSKDLEKIQIENLSSSNSIYMSPELYNRIDGKNKDQQYDRKKNDSFALGLTLLECGLGESVQDIYEKKGVVNRDVLYNHMAKFDKEYKGSNPNLSKIVNNLIEVDPEHRLNSLDLLHSINQPVGQFQQTQSNIVNAQPFTQTSYVVNSTPFKGQQNNYKAMSFVNTNFQYAYPVQQYQHLNKQNDQKDETEKQGEKEQQK